MSSAAPASTTLDRLRANPTTASTFEIRTDGGDDSVSLRHMLDHAREATQLVKKPGIFGAATNMINFVCGTGVLGVPLAVAQTGWAVALVLLIAMAAVSGYTMHLLARVSEERQQFNY